ncbi:hypothetical protein DFS33DRAFT_1311461 [Desarmillaria ectypa]|nr:hypothetical protein DFS33DRAFT_1311461 [Desarmillaria ectypa]
MWREYSLRRQWDMLGIEEDDKTATESDRALIIDEFRGQDDVIPIEVDDDAEKDKGEDAQKEIMKGAIVKSVISNAVEGEYIMSVYSVACSETASKHHPKLNCSNH